MKNMKQCSVEVYESSTWRFYPCQKPASIKVDDKWYCKIHSPEYIKAKAEKQEQKYQKNSCKCSYHFDRDYYSYCPMCGKKRFN